MITKNTIVSMDIGTSNVRVIVGEVTIDGTVNIIGVGNCPSLGLKKGVIVDIDKTSKAIEMAVEEAERMSGIEIDSAFLGIIGSQVELINNKGVVAVTGEDREITEEDVIRVLQAAKVVAIPPDREIIEIIPREFVLDGYDGINDPVGMLGVRLEVDAMIISGMSTIIRNLVRCVNNSGIEIKGMVLNSLANGEVVLSRDEKELGTVLLDYGGGTIDIAVFRHGHLQSIKVLPLGGDHITNDIAVGLKATFEQAEKIKLRHSCVSPEIASTERNIDVVSVTGKETEAISEVEIAEIVEPRIIETMLLIKRELEEMGYNEPLPAGLVLTGGVSSMKGIQDLAESIYECPVRISQPSYIGVKSPIYSTAVGMIHYIRMNNMSTNADNNTSARIGSIFGRFKEWIMDFFS